MQPLFKFQFRKSCSKVLLYGFKEVGTWPLFQEPPFVDSLDKPVYNEISVAHSLLLRDTHIFEVAENLTPRLLVILVVIQDAARREPPDGSNALFAVAAFVILLQSLQGL